MEEEIKTELIPVEELSKKLGVEIHQVVYNEEDEELKDTYVRENLKKDDFILYGTIFKYNDALVELIGMYDYDIKCQDNNLIFTYTPIYAVLEGEVEEDILENKIKEIIDAVFWTNLQTFLVNYDKETLHKIVETSLNNEKEVK